MAQLTGTLLSAPLLNVEELPVRCKKSGRVLAQLRRAQEQMRTIQADRQRQAEYRQAVIQQYAFLGSFLRRLADRLGERRTGSESIYTPLVQIYGNRRPENNGDRCMYFSGVENQYYIILCDGMGTGPGAVQEGNQAGNLLKQMLVCGFPAEEALESLNSLCALRDRAGAVTVDLAQVSLDTGKVTIYKWGSAPSYLLAGDTMEKLGTSSAPPGMSATERCQVRCALTLRKGQTLLLVSDGLEEADILEDGKKNISPAVLAAELLKNRSGQDDATIVTVQLISSQT
jgi:serine phosphatase RsbU (regulator of sigma subunit)